MLLMWKWMGQFLRKNHLLRCWNWLSIPNWTGAHIISIAKTACKKIGALINSMKFVSSEVALYLYKSTIQPCMKCCCHVWAGALSCYLKLLDKPHKTDTQDSCSFTCSLLNPWVIIEMWPADIFSLGITLVDFHPNWLSWFHFLILDRCMTFFCHHS